MFLDHGSSWVPETLESEIVDSGKGICVQGGCLGHSLGSIRVEQGGHSRGGDGGGWHEGQERWRKAGRLENYLGCDEIYCGK